jgi:hypothetical protein
VYRTLADLHAASAAAARLAEDHTAELDHRARAEAARVRLLEIEERRTRQEARRATRGWRRARVTPGE